MSEFDVIIIGSGFGGAVTAARLAEKGMKVLVLERGRRWNRQNFPSVTNRDYIWDRDCPEKCNGWFDFRVFRDMTVVQGAGVGGGSLVYANVSVEAKDELFNQGWPPEITIKELRPYYDRVTAMLTPHRLPANQLTRRFQIMKEGAEKLGYGDRFRSLDIAITFDPEWTYTQPDPFNYANSKPWINAQGVEQGTCVHCGNCDLGCPTGARNTLDLNYIPLAEKHGAVVKDLHLVDVITVADGAGYEVKFQQIKDGKFISGSQTARRVIVAAGSMGSTELLLRCRDEHKTLPHLSPFLGCNWSSNGDFLTPAFHDPEHRISPTRGPTITSAIDFLDGLVDNQQFFIEDGGFPPVLNNFLQEQLQRRHANPFVEQIYGWLREKFGERIRNDDPLSNAMPWFSQGIDAADGHLYLRRSWLAPWRRPHMDLRWEIKRSQYVIEAIIRMHKRLAAATGGIAAVPPTWTILKNLITPHPLGGCNMGINCQNGVVNHAGQVFNYPGLYVADGAIIPEAIGLNPSKTIAALAERIADLM